MNEQLTENWQEKLTRLAALGVELPDNEAAEKANPIAATLKTLPSHELDAIYIMVFFLNAYNDKDGIGLAKGPARYSVLEQRVTLSATRSQNVQEFWSNIRRKLNLGILPSKFDSMLLDIFNLNEQQKICTALANQSSEICSIARLLHTHDKETRRAKK
jgi:hypothetical protein